MEAAPSFSSLPSDIKKEILSLAIFGSMRQPLRLQTTSKEFQGLIWKSVIRFSDMTLIDRSCTNKLFDRMDKTTVKYLEIAPMPPSPKNENFELNLADFPALEYLAMDIQEFVPMLMTPRLKEAFMKHKTLTSVSCNCGPIHTLDNDLITEISQTKKLLVKRMDVQRGSPTLSYFHIDYPVKCGPSIGGFDGAPTVGCATKNFVLVGSDNGTVSVLTNKDEQLKIVRSVKAHQGRINDMYFNHPKGNVFIASSDGSVSLWDNENNFEEPRASIKFKEPIIHVVATLVKNTELVLAAGKQTAYFIDRCDETEAIKSIPIGADIIRIEDLANSRKGFAVYTRERIHHFTESGEEIGSFSTSYPSNSFFGNSEIHIIPRENDAQVKLVSKSKTDFYDGAVVRTLARKYDATPRTCGFLDSLKLVLLSTGYGFEAVDILHDEVPFSIGLPVTKKEIESKTYKHVVGIFVQGRVWYVIGSDGKLYSWKLVDRKYEFMYLRATFDLF